VLASGVDISFRLIMMVKDKGSDIADLATGRLARIDQRIFS